MCATVLDPRNKLKGFECDREEIRQNLEDELRQLTRGNNSIREKRNKAISIMPNKSSFVSSVFEVNF
jgi:hypothetical protein